MVPLDNDDIKQLIAILQKGLSDDEDIKPIKTKTTRRSTNKTKPIKPKIKNKFDTMPESKMHKEDIEFDSKVKKPAPSARLREFEPIKVKCRVCGKNEKVVADLIESIERYKCNKCATGAG